MQVKDKSASVAKKLPLVPVILSGGMGSRLWPMSRSKLPKQFLGINGQGKASLLEQTASRVKNGGSMTAPLIVCNTDHRFLVADHLMRAGFNNTDIILEPEGRNTAPAITAAALYLKERHGDALMLVLPSDHVIRDGDAFGLAVKSATEAAREGSLVTFGITPEYPETGYGYIHQGGQVNGFKDVFKVDGFVEKPTLDVARGYVESGAYSWNSGMFLFPVSIFLAEMEKYQPAVVKACQKALEKGEKDADFIRLDKEAFVRAPSISVDYAVMEHTKLAAVVPVSCGWSDAGAWDSLWRIGEKDENGNVNVGKIYSRDTKNCYLHVEDGAPIATLGIEDLVVVSMKDTVLVARKDRAQDVKKLMEEVKEENKDLVDHHQRVYRPWGFYETIQLGARHQVKHIQVKPGAKLSVQMHHHRAEHWIVVSGTAQVQCDGEEKILTENQHFFIPLGSVHAVENIGKIPLDFIEVQHGGYLGEDDIVRFSDRYGREGTNT